MRRPLLLFLPFAALMAAAGVVGATDGRRPLVVIDAGHGGRDNGAQPAGVPVPEKTITLAVADALRDRLLRGGRVRVAMTREDDRYVGLEERVRIARRLGASLFVAMHADSAPNPEARGATIYTLSEVASDREAARLAARENGGRQVESAPGQSADANVRAILADLAFRGTMEDSANFARLLRREAGGAGVPFRETSHRFAAFVVLKGADVPAVLLEAGYLTNKDDAAFLLSPEGRGRIAEGAARAIETHAARQRFAGSGPGR